MRLTYLVAASLAMAMSVPALAADTKDVAKDHSQDAPKEKKICRTERVTGSLVSQRRICMTTAEWDKLALETKKDLDDVQRNGNAVPRTIDPAPPNQGGMTAGFQ